MSIFYGGEIDGLQGEITIDGLNLILDLLDEYIELKEEMNDGIES